MYPTTSALQGALDNIHIVSETNGLRRSPRISKGVTYSNRTPQRFVIHRVWNGSAQISEEDNISCGINGNVERSGEVDAIMRSTDNSE